MLKQLCNRLCDTANGGNDGKIGWWNKNCLVTEHQPKEKTKQSCAFAELNKQCLSSSGNRLWDTADGGKPMAEQ